MDKIIFFDIDGTLFNPVLFLENFSLMLSEKFELGDNFSNKLQAIYEQARNKNGYFIPSVFLGDIIKQYPQISLTKLQKIFWDIDLFRKSMYKDTSVLKDLSSLATIGIFSKGDKEFQEQKISFIKYLLDDKDVYIFPNKIEKISEVLKKYSGYVVYMVDDILDVLVQAKKIDPNLFAILIDRSNNYGDNKDIVKIDNLNETREII